jgi:hypothetical protein
MKRVFVAVLLGLGVMAAPALATPLMANAAGNTYVVTTADGAVVRYHFNDDGSFDYVTPDNHTVHGTYTVANGQICLTAEAGQPQCTGYAGDKNVGDTWTQKASDGTDISVALVAGRP